MNRFGLFKRMVSVPAAIQRGYDFSGLIEAHPQFAGLPHVIQNILIVDDDCADPRSINRRSQMTLWADRLNMATVTYIDVVPEEIGFAPGQKGSVQNILVERALQIPESQPRAYQLVLIDGLNGDGEGLVRCLKENPESNCFWIAGYSKDNEHNEAMRLAGAHFSLNWSHKTDFFDFFGEPADILSPDFSLLKFD